MCYNAQIAFDKYRKITLRKIKTMEQQIFKDFDLAIFWDDNDYSLKEYVEGEPSDELIDSVEQELGYKLPASYIELMKLHNGGVPNNTCFPTSTPTSWANNHVAITGILGIGRIKAHSLAGRLGSQFMIEEWGYPGIGICICDCPSAGHDMIMLDYSKCGKDGEPEVVHVDQESDYKKTFLAKDFETFIRGLVNSDVFDTSEEDLKDTLESIKAGDFSDILQSFFKNESSTNFEKILRNALTELTSNKGYFALHADELSYLIYDIQFYLFSRNRKLRSKEEYLKEYPQMIAFGNKDITTRGYGPGFIDDWLQKRLSKNEIIKGPFNELSFSKEYEKMLFSRIKKYE